MIVVDTSALIAMLIDEPEAVPFLSAIIDDGDAVAAAPTAFEFMMVAQGERLNRADADIATVLANVRIVPWTPPLADIAQVAFLKFGKGRHPAKLNFGDCMSYALAKSLNCPLLFKGDDFAQTDIVSALAVSQ